MQGRWIAERDLPCVDPNAIASAIGQVNEPVTLVDSGGYLAVVARRSRVFLEPAARCASLPHRGFRPAHSFGTSR